MIQICTARGRIHGIQRHTALFRSAAVAVGEHPPSSWKSAVHGDGVREHGMPGQEFRPILKPARKHRVKLDAKSDPAAGRGRWVSNLVLTIIPRVLPQACLRVRTSVLKVAWRLLFLAARLEGSAMGRSACLDKSTVEKKQHGEKAQWRKSIKVSWTKVSWRKNREKNIVESVVGCS